MTARSIPKSFINSGLKVYTSLDIEAQTILEINEKYKKGIQLTAEEEEKARIVTAKRFEDTTGVYDDYIKI